MRFPSWLDGPKPASSRRRTKHVQLRSPLRKPVGCRLAVEILEVRRMPIYLPAVSYDAGTNPQALLTADFNGDGRLDLAVVNNNGYVNNGTVSVLLGNADGTFQPARTSPTGAGPVSLAVGDFNGDGKLDLAV